MQPSQNKMRRALAAYLLAYIETELERGGEIEVDTLLYAIEAFEGGASASGLDYKLTLQAITN